MFSRQALAVAAFTTAWSTSSSTSVASHGRDHLELVTAASGLMRREVGASTEVALLQHRSGPISAEALATRATMATEQAMRILQNPQDFPGPGLMEEVVSQEPGIIGSAETTAAAEKWRARVAEAQRIVEADKRLKAVQAAAEKAVEQTGGGEAAATVATAPAVSESSVSSPASNPPGARIATGFADPDKSAKAPKDDDKEKGAKASNDDDKEKWAKASRDIQEDQAAREKADKFVVSDKKSFEDAEFEQWKKNVREKQMKDSSTSPVSLSPESSEKVIAQAKAEKDASSSSEATKGETAPKHHEVDKIEKESKHEAEKSEKASTHDVEKSSEKESTSSSKQQHEASTSTASSSSSSSSAQKAPSPAQKANSAKKATDEAEATMAIR